jgi:hypothetical protein
MSKIIHSKTLHVYTHIVLWVYQHFANILNSRTLLNLGDSKHDTINLNQRN